MTQQQKSNIIALRDQMRYAGLGEVEAGGNPVDPHIFPLSYPDSSPSPPPPQISPIGSQSSSLACPRLTSLLPPPVPPVIPPPRSSVGTDAIRKDEPPPPAADEIHKQVHMGREMLAGSASAVVSRFCVAPLDVLKIRFQIQEQATNRQYTSVLQAFKTIYQKEGLLVRKQHGTKVTSESGRIMQIIVLLITYGGAYVIYL